MIVAVFQNLPGATANRINVFESPVAPYAGKTIDDSKTVATDIPMIPPLGVGSPLSDDSGFAGLVANA